MKLKTTLVSLIGAMVIGTTGYVGYQTYEPYEKSNENDLLFENIEALAQTEIMLKCTRPVKYGSCYDEDNMWRGTFIDEVEVYEVALGSPITCQHASKQSCPPGTHKGDVIEG
ncbi:hypothetical protein [Paraprevotella xylaniphila]|uniref:hypothetical protein n=1 Tax=Paraprevotella xylaniphila TaxID=454155 RepID=UPI001032974F|nr:hypothetical protein [Paraprevotella xylaniphila]